MEKKMEHEMETEIILGDYRRKGFPETTGTFLGVPIIRIEVCLGSIFTVVDLTLVVLVVVVVAAAA